MTIDSSRFTEFFQEVHRGDDGSTYDPFPWQQRLAERVCTSNVEDAGHGHWPDALALPTGSGKTTCIDIAVFALACQTFLPTDERTAPRRILFVVDRRVIVDEAFQHALSVARRLHDARGGILKEVADALRQIAGSDTPLTCHQLRGGMYRDDAWARTPSQPCVIASTVDQIGSRILFRGYGRSFKSWPVQAGLAGNDALILLDEAHCANPFRQTMHAVNSYRQPPWSETPLSSPFQFVILSATPPTDCGTIISAKDEDRSHPVLGPRLNAPKPTKLIVAARAKGTHAQRELAVTLVEEALAAASDHDAGCDDTGPPAVAILVNRVWTAKLVDELLGAIAGRESTTFDARTVKRIAKKYRESLPQYGDSFDHELMTGRMRPVDRQDVTDEWLNRLSAGRAGQRRLERPVFITATQCLEVGANLDFDVMISECASLDALRQRFGRLNRTGRDIPAPAAVVIRKDQESARNSDPVYGDALTSTWQQLQTWLRDETARRSDDAKSQDTDERDEESGTPECEPAIDFGVTAMESRWDALSSAERAALLPPAPDAPVMLPAHVDCWVQTSPIPQPSPDVSVFLHGPQRGAPDIQVCWRADLPERAAWPRNAESKSLQQEFEKEVTEAVSICPPSSMECLTVPRHLFLDWWLQRSAQNADELADVDAAPGEEPEFQQPQRSVALIWRGPKDSQLLRHPKQLRPGDTLVLPSSAGGWDHFGHVPLRPGQSIDAGDRCHWLSRGKAVLRLRKGQLDQWPETESKSRQALVEILEDSANDPDALPDTEALLELLRDMVGHPDVPDWLRNMVEQGLPRNSKPELLPHPFGGIVLRSRRRVRTQDTLSASDTFTTEDDMASCGGQVTLNAHCKAVAERAREFARRCNLSPAIVETMFHAGRVHDLGKADRRFQAFLFGGNQQVADLAGNLFAKSAGLRDHRRGYDMAWDDAELPDGFRHELLSLQLAEHFSAQLDLNPSGPGSDGESTNIDPDLLLHLVTMHHGHGRPFAPVVIDEPAHTESLEIDLRPSGCDIAVTGDQRQAWVVPHRIDSGIAERFWRLVRRYGWWGLAWLEAIFVLADHRTSEAETQTKSISRRQPRSAKKLKGATT